MKHRGRKRILVALACVLLTACSARQQPAGDGTGQLVTVLSVDPNQLVMNQLGATASLTIGSDGAVTNADVLWQSSDETVVTVSTQGLVTAMGEGTATVTAGMANVSATATVIVSTTAFTISGIVYYEDKQYTSNGFTGTSQYYPVRYAKVELVDSNDSVLLSSITGGDGAYTLGPFVDTTSRVRVRAQTDDTSLPQTTVTDYSGNIYAASKTVELGTGVDAVMDLQIAVKNAGGAFNILDVLTYAAQRVKELSTTTLPALNAVWNSGSSSLGTWYCNGYDVVYCPRGAAIYVLGGGISSDTDEYDDDVLWHEFSHYLENQFGIADSPGGPHKFTDNDLDLRLSWSEGFGDFFPAAMKTWMRSDHAAYQSIPDTLDTAYYIDTFGASALSINIGNPGNAPFVYASNEIAVANVMHRLHGTYGMTTLWQVYENQLPAAAGSVNLEAVWNGWLAQFSPDSTILAQLQFYFANRLIYYQQDSFESGDAPGSARVLTVCAAGQTCAGEQHTLYKNDLSADTDFFQFNLTAGQNYRIETLDLSNGADTHIRLVDGQGQMLKENDDRAGNVCCLPNNGLTLSSSLDFIPTSTSAYFAEVITSPGMAVSAGASGTYSIKISEN